MNKQLDENFKKRLLEYYKEANQTEIKFNIEMLFEDITEEEYFVLLNLIKRYNKRINGESRENLQKTTDN